MEMEKYDEKEIIHHVERVRLNIGIEYINTDRTVRTEQKRTVRIEQKRTVRIEQNRREFY